MLRGIESTNAHANALPQQPSGPDLQKLAGQNPGAHLFSSFATLATPGPEESPKPRIKHAFLRMTSPSTNWGSTANRGINLEKPDSNAVDNNPERSVSEVDSVAFSDVQRQKSPSFQSTTTLRGGDTSSQTASLGREVSSNPMRVYSLQKQGEWRQEKLSHADILQRLAKLDLDPLGVLDKKLDLPPKHQARINAIQAQVNSEEVSRNDYDWKLRQLELKGRRLAGLSLGRSWGLLAIIVYLERECQQHSYRDRVRQSSTDQHNMGLDIRPWKCLAEDCKYHEYGWPTEEELDSHCTDEHTTAPPMYACSFSDCPYESKRQSSCRKHIERAHNWQFTRNMESFRHMSGSRPQPRPRKRTLSIAQSTDQDFVWPVYGDKRASSPLPNLATITPPSVQQESQRSPILHSPPTSRKARRALPSRSPRPFSPHEPGPGQVGKRRSINMPSPLDARYDPTLKPYMPLDPRSGLHQIGQTGSDSESSDSPGTPAQADHAEAGQTSATSTSNRATNRRSLAETFSTSSQTLEPYPELNLSHQAEYLPPQVVHYHGQRGGSQAKSRTPSIPENTDLPLENPCKLVITTPSFDCEMDLASISDDYSQAPPKPTPLPSDPTFRNYHSVPYRRTKKRGRSSYISSSATNSGPEGVTDDLDITLDSTKTPTADGDDDDDPCMPGPDQSAVTADQPSSPHDSTGDEWPGNNDDDVSDSASWPRAERSASVRFGGVRPLWASRRAGAPMKAADEHSKDDETYVWSSASDGSILDAPLSQTLHLRTGADSSQADGTSMEFGSYEEVSFPTSPPMPGSYRNVGNAREGAQRQRPHPHSLHLSLDVAPIPYRATATVRSSPTKAASGPGAGPDSELDDDLIKQLTLLLTPAKPGVHSEATTPLTV